MPPHQYAGVAGFRLQVDGECPAAYSPLQGVCAHQRLIAAESPEALRAALQAFVAGAVPPIVADAPPPGARNPSRMDPGELRATEAQLARQDKARAQLARYREQWAEYQESLERGEEAEAPEKPSEEVIAAAAAEPAPQRVAVFQGGAPADGSSRNNGASPLTQQRGAGGGTQIPPGALQQLQQLQQITGDGQVDANEAAQLFKMLRDQASTMQDLPAELQLPSK